MLGKVSGISVQGFIREIVMKGCDPNHRSCELVKCHFKRWLLYLQFFKGHKVLSEKELETLHLS